MKKVLISSCLLGVSCRYDGRSVPNDNAKNLSDKFLLVPFCPEIYGGLPTPRIPSERVGERVLSKVGTDVTENYYRGASEGLKLCHDMGIEIALLKEKSPACGNKQIYDGTFSGTLVDGEGVLAELLRKNGIKVYGESQIEDLIKENLF